VSTQRRRLINQGKAVLRRHGIALPKEADIKTVGRREIASLPGEERVILLSALRQLGPVEAELDELDAEVARQVAYVPEVRRLLTITGVGVVTAAIIWAWIGDPNRFKGPKQVGRYAGLDATVLQSGEQDRRGRISKQGNRQLRAALIEAAQVVARHDSGYLGQFYQHKLHQIGHKRAVVALARKLLIVAWQLMRTGHRSVRATVMKRKLAQLRQACGRPEPWQALLDGFFPEPAVTDGPPPRRKRARSPAA
jgi:transposase